MGGIWVLGAGFGGITAALELRARLPPPHAIHLVDERSEFLMGLAKLWALDGRRPLPEGRRDLSELRAKGIDVVTDTVTAIDPQTRRVTMGKRTITADALVVALGARPDPSLTLGLPPAANFYDAANIDILAARLRHIQKGRVLVQICALPFKCPPAPYEAALLVDALLRKRGVRQAVEVRLATPEPHPLPVAPPQYGDHLRALLSQRNIAYDPNHRPVRVDADKVLYENGNAHAFDLLLAVPPHAAPKSCASMLGPAGWIPADRSTLKTQWPRVYAVGDVAAVPLPSGKLMPKAGVLAEGQARAAAEHLAAELLGRASSAAFDGRGVCFVEAGDGKAIAAEGEFFADPHPRFTFGPPTADALADKQRFESHRLTAWFGN